MLINLTNHPSAKWHINQITAGEKYGEIIDIPFPEIDPYKSSEYIDALVEEYYNKIMEYDNPVVVVQGEYLFVFRMVTRLKAGGIKVLAACSDRRTIEYIDAAGHTARRSEFEFVDFKEY